MELRCETSAPGEAVNPGLDKNKAELRVLVLLVLLHVLVHLHLPMLVCFLSLEAVFLRRDDATI